MARKTKKRRYLQEAKRQHKFLRRWSDRPKDKLNPNCVHREVLLSAELDATSGKITTAFQKFEVAIRMAGRSGIVQDQALANERYAALCLEQGDHEEYIFRMNSAIRLYMEWGASAKVDKLISILNPDHRKDRFRTTTGSIVNQDILSNRSTVLLDRVLDDEEKLRELEQEASIRGFTTGSSVLYVSR